MQGDHHALMKLFWPGEGLSHQAGSRSLEGLGGAAFQLHGTSWAGAAGGQQAGKGPGPHEGEAVDGEKERGLGKVRTCLHTHHLCIRPSVKGPGRWVWWAEPGEGPKLFALGKNLVAGPRVCGRRAKALFLATHALVSWGQTPKLSPCPPNQKSGK